MLLRASPTFLLCNGYEAWWVRVDDKVWRLQPRDAVGWDGIACQSQNGPERLRTSAGHTDTGDAPFRVQSDLGEERLQRKLHCVRRVPTARKLPVRNAPTLDRTETRIVGTVRLSVQALVTLALSRYEREHTCNLCGAERQMHQRRQEGEKPNSQHREHPSYPKGSFNSRRSDLQLWKPSAFASWQASLGFASTWAETAKASIE
ncbi:uncharacterized protein MEPE_00786 [Melanopsichium pennsylvanicum]|uniref:Uncharacterized protein n=1 Tax=Melanopsichium pennsylvanicum TaxID=63383 RepID=A0AAJ5C303_9BASI|nr:uncharacterized protein MEPE_00786 [Melanopsichium pennsylvanicum]